MQAGVINNGINLWPSIFEQNYYISGKDRLGKCMIVNYISKNECTANKAKVWDNRQLLES